MRRYACSISVLVAEPFESPLVRPTSLHKEVVRHGQRRFIFFHFVSTTHTCAPLNAQVCTCTALAWAHTWAQRLSDLTLHHLDLRAGDTERPVGACWCVCVCLSCVESPAADFVLDSLKQ